MPKDFQINRRGIAKISKEIEKEFNRNPVKVRLEADPSLGQTPELGGSTHVYNGPVVHGDVSGGIQNAVGNSGTVNQNQAAVTPGYEAVAAALDQVLAALPGLAPSDEQQEDADTYVEEVRTEIVSPAPSAGRIRRAVNGLNGIMKALITAASAGAATEVASGAHELGQAAIEQLGQAIGQL